MTEQQQAESQMTLSGIDKKQQLIFLGLLSPAKIILILHEGDVHELHRSLMNEAAAWAPRST